jgi:hypothetical protein
MQARGASLRSMGGTRLGAEKVVECFLVNEATGGRLGLRPRRVSLVSVLAVAVSPFSYEIFVRFTPAHAGCSRRVDASNS